MMYVSLEEKINKHSSTQLQLPIHLLMLQQVPPTILENFLSRIEEGYCKFHNPYHNNLHAADVSQTVHYMLCQTGLMVRIKPWQLEASKTLNVLGTSRHFEAYLPIRFPFRFLQPGLNSVSGFQIIFDSLIQKNWATPSGHFSLCLKPSTHSSQTFPRCVSRACVILTASTLIAFSWPKPSRQRRR